MDEVPQLLNILAGSMSLVGPRPLSIEDLKIMEKTTPELYYKRTLLHSKPGLTGCWQVFGDRNQGVKNLIRYDEFYEEKKSLMLDLYIIIRSISIMVSAKHSDAIIDCKYKIEEKTS